MFLPEWLQKGCKVPCKLIDFIICDEESQLYYRNKSELTIQKDWEGIVRVGYNRGNISKGVHLAECAKNNILTSRQAIEVSELLETLIHQNHDLYPYYDKSNNKGFWRYLVVKQSFKTKQILINIVVCDAELEDKKAPIQLISKFFIDNLKL